MPERESSVEELQNLVEGYAKTFIQRRDCYPQQMPDGSYRTKYAPLTSALLLQHVQGEITLGAYALDRESQGQWLCFDADEETQWARLWDFAKKLEMVGLNPYLELSRRGGHLWLFTPRLSGKNIRQLGLQLAKAHGLEGIEIYPKQTELTIGVGSLVRLPLGIHRKSGKRYPFINLKREALAPSIREQMAVLAQPKRVPTGYIEEVLATVEKPCFPSPVQFEKHSSSHDLPVSERLKRAMSVADFVQQFVDLDAQGRGLCPFHDDQHQSFQVHEARNFWHCYAGCGGGSLIDFWMKWRAAHGQSSNFTDTIKDLAQLLLN